MPESFNFEYITSESAKDRVVDFIRNKGKKVEFLIQDLHKQLGTSTLDEIKILLKPYCQVYFSENYPERLQITLKPKSARKNNLTTKSYKNL